MSCSHQTRRAIAPMAPPYRSGLKLHSEARSGQRSKYPIWARATALHRSPRHTMCCERHAKHDEGGRQVSGGAGGYSSELRPVPPPNDLCRRSRRAAAPLYQDPEQRSLPIDDPESAWIPAAHRFQMHQPPSIRSRYRFRLNRQPLGGATYTHSSVTTTKYHS